MNTDRLQDAITELEKTGQLNDAARDISPEQVEQLLAEAGRLAEELMSSEPQIRSEPPRTPPR